MRIGIPTSSVADGKARISATVTWEEGRWGEREVYFDTDDRFGEDLTPDASPFLLAAFIPAMRYGERRILVAGRVCPELRDGLITVMQQLQKWYGETNRPVLIEATEGFSPSDSRSVPHTASCMSGGVDSLATFRQNRIGFPLNHSGSIKDLIMIYGFDMGGHEAWDGNLPSFERARLALSKMAAAESATLIPVYSNMRCLEGDAPGLYYTDIFVYQSFGACLAAVAHALSRRITRFLVPSSHDVTDLEPLGSHPIIDPNYSSSSLFVRHDGLGYSRLQKMRLISDWDAGLQSLRVCADPIRPPEVVNCGQCEKCLRTMATLLILGKLNQCPTFEANDIKPFQIQSLRWTLDTTGGSPFAYLSGSSARFWKQLIEPLRQMNRDDLAGAIMAKLKEFDQIVVRMRWKARIKWLDRKLLGNAMSKVRRTARNRLA